MKEKAMACNENVIKNMANEVTRNCQTLNLSVDPEFVVYLIDLLLLNPKYGKLFAKTINRNNLQLFVEKCVEILKSGKPALHTLKMQFLIQTNYDKIQNLIDKQMESIAKCLQPLLNEILDEDPDSDEESLADFRKLFRKISIYIILASGLGNPGLILTLKEGMAALESVFSMEDLKLFVGHHRSEKIAQLEDLVEVVSGVRLFNRDCKKGGEAIPDLPFNLVDAGKACLTSLSNSLISVMQRVNNLTAAIEDAVIVEEETGNVEIMPRNPDLTEEKYKTLFDLLAFNRQYEIFIRKLLSDVEKAVLSGSQAVEKCKFVLEELHHAVKYKAAVPVVTVFPLFTKLWRVWRSMQHVMFIVSRVSRLMTALAAIQEHVAVPRDLVDAMHNSRQRARHQEKSTSKTTTEDRVTLSTMKEYIVYNDPGMKDKHLSYLGFCAMCLTVGALVPNNMKVGTIMCEGRRYSFCSSKMAATFGKDPKRYINENVQYARNHPHIINLLNIVEDVEQVKDIDELIVKYIAKTKVSDKDIQTEAHPVESYIQKNYSSDLWEWKRRACQWATIVKCRTHSTQTDHSHLRSEIHCQTYEMKDKGYQTKKDLGVNTVENSVFLWGLRGLIGPGQQCMDMGEKHSGERKKTQVISACSWPCIESNNRMTAKEERDIIKDATPETKAAEHAVQESVQSIYYE